MNQDPRLHVRRRRLAIDRLRSLTTGAAVAGVAGVAGFGLLAAATWSGDPSKTGATTTTTTDDSGGADDSSGSGTNGTNGSVAKPTQRPMTTTPRVQRGTSPGHAATGGSH